MTSTQVPRPGLDLLGEGVTARTEYESAAAGPVEPYRPWLQGIRGLAITAVVLDSCGVPHLGTAGDVGLEVFLGLSFLLVTSRVVRQVDRTGDFGVTAFVRRRLRRVVVPLGLVVVTTLALVLALGVDPSAPPLQHVRPLAVGVVLYVGWTWLLVGLALVASWTHWAVRRGLVALGGLAVVVAGLGMAHPFQVPTSITDHVWPMGVGIALGLVRLPVDVPLLGWRPLRFLGATSYGWYLWHWPALALAPTVFGQRLGWTDNLVVCVLALWAATITHLALERPLQRPAESRR